MVVSLGTGMVPVSELKEIDVFRPDSFFDAAKLAYGISAIGTSIFVSYRSVSIKKKIPLHRQFAGRPGDGIGRPSGGSSESLVQYDRCAIFQVQYSRPYILDLQNSFHCLFSDRFNPQMSTDIAMDEKNDLKLVNMLWETKAYMHANRHKVIEMINLLK